MTKFEALQKRYEQANAIVEKEQKLAAAKQEKLDELKKAETEVAEAGDLVKYQEIKKQRTDLEDEIFVLKFSDPVGTMIKKDDVHGAWDECAKAYRKSVVAIEKELEKKTAELAAVYKKLEAVQDQLLQQREKLAEMGRIEPDHSNMFDNYAGSLPVEFVGLKTRSILRIHHSHYVLVEYLAAAGELTDDDVAWSNMLFYSHKRF